MPRVLIVCEYGTIAGGERSMLATLSGLREAGFEIVVAIASPDARQSPLYAAVRALGVEAVAIAEQSDSSVNPSPIANLSRQELLARLSSLVTRFKPDVVHANSLAMGRKIGGAGNDWQIPTIAHLRDIITLGAKGIAELNQHTLLIAVSSAVRDAHVRQGLDQARVVVSYNGVDLDEFSPRSLSGELQGELGIAPDAKIALTVGQICLRKGLDVALAAMKQAMILHPDLHWVIVGERFSQKDESRALERRLRDAAAAAETAGRIHFLGARDDVAWLMNHSTFLLHTARQEPLGRVLLEATASGLPVVATNVGGTREIFPEEDQAAKIVAPDDSNAMTLAMNELLANESLRCELVVRARKIAVERFNLLDATARLADFYRQAIEGKPR